MARGSKRGQLLIGDWDQDNNITTNDESQTRGSMLGLIEEDKNELIVTQEAPENYTLDEVLHSPMQSLAHIK